MGEGKFALVSRHAILPHVQQSAPAIVLVQGECIEAVEVFADESALEKGRMELRGWEVVDLQDAYLSPGIIDCNVISNSEWESRDVLTKCAVSGGVTMLLEEPSLYAHSKSAAPLYCDVGTIQMVSSLSDFPTSTPAFAYKIYLSAPSVYVQSFSEPLEALFDSVIHTPLPLFIDPSIPSSRMLYMASPYRMNSVEERVAVVYVDESRFSAGAFQDEDAIDSSSSEIEEEPYRPDRSQSTLEEHCTEGQQFSACGEEQEDSWSSHRQRGLTEDLEKLAQPNSQLPTIISDLNKRIDHLQESQYDLSVSEQMTYDGAGAYEYNETSSAGSGPRKKGSSSSSSTSQSPTLTRRSRTLAAGPVLQRIKIRPKPLTLNPKYSNGSIEQNYATHLGHVPDYWEIKGIKKVLKAVRTAPCRVHFCNVASAAAVNKVRLFCENGLADSVTVETCPHYLFFTLDDIEAGNTRLKTFPPIRNKSNCNLLWELLKVKAIDILSSHHNAIAQDLKFLDTGNFKKALNGIRAIGMSLQAVWTKLRMPAVDSPAVRERYIARLAKWMSLDPAKLIGISHKRGSIEKGKFADLIVWNPHEEFEAEGDLNPYRGKKLYGKVKAVYVRGKLAFRDGEYQQVGQVLDRRDLVR